MKSNYKKLGDYIREVNIRNTDLSVSILVGVSMEKTFISSVANIVDTDMSVYKILKKGQLACKLMSVGRDEKLPVDLYKEEEPAVVSSAYYVFEPIDTNILHPEYLFMWLCRPENDRYIGYISGGDVRGGISWNTFCEIPINVPSIEKQREIVKEYNVIKDRIELNNKLIQKLEETAQAIYKQWFVDFEFPNEDGKPYKSSGGEMVWCEELEKEVPKGWEVKDIASFSKDIVCGKTPPTNDEKNYGDFMPFLTIPDMHNKIFALETERFLSLQGVETQKNKTLPENSICVSCIGTAGIVVLTSEPCQTNQQINSVICKDDICHYYMYFSLKELGNMIKEWGNKGSVGVNMNKTEFSVLLLLQPDKNKMKEFNTLVDPIFKGIKSHQKESLALRKMKDLLLSKLATVDD
jgi:type I restriction enzyme S subunit